MTLPFFLSSPNIFESAEYAQLDRANAEQLATLAQTIAADDSLRQSAEQLHADTYANAPTWGLSFSESIFGEQTHKLYLLIALDAVRQLRSVHKERAIPETVTRTTATALTNAARRFADWHEGKLGIESWVLRYWFNVVGSGNLYRLGRMEFIFEPFTGNIRVYRHRKTGQVQALAEEGVNFAGDGYLPFVLQSEESVDYGWSHESDEVWTTALHENAEQVTGTPISPLGFALRQELTLPLADWELILRNGDPVLDMHIPNFAPLTLDLLKDSFIQALDFFPRVHPERPFKAFACNSWVFNTQWVEMLPTSSNLLAFQRQGYLFPLPSDGAEGLYFLFGSWSIDLDSAPQDTVLRRAVVNHLKNRGKLRSGGFLLFPTEVDRFGSEPYRSCEAV